MVEFYKKAVNKSMNLVVAVVKAKVAPIFIEFLVFVADLDLSPLPSAGRVPAPGR